MRSSPVGPAGSYRSALEHRDLRLLLGGLAVSATGNWAYKVGLLAFVFDRTHSLTWVAAATLARYIPSLLLGIYGGVIAERVQRIRLMAWSDRLCALWQAGLAITVATHGPVLLALVLAALTSASNVVYSPAVAAAIPSLVGEDDLVAANAMKGTIDSLVVIAGPAIGTALLLLGRPGLVFGVNAASFLVSAAIVSRIGVRSRTVDVRAGGAAGPLRQMAVGMRTIFGLRAAQTAVAFFALGSFVYGTDPVLLVGVSAHKLGTGSDGFGYLFAALGVGGVAMTPVVNRLAGSRGLAPIMICGLAGYTLPTALLTAIHSVSIAFALEVVRGASTLVVDVLAVTALQRAVPTARLARAFGVFFVFAVAGNILGTVVAPEVVRAFGFDAALLSMAFVPFAIGLLGYPALMAIDRDTASRAAALAPNVALLEQLGMFATASRPMLERLAGQGVSASFDAGEAIVRQGDPADALYILSEGEVEVRSRGETDAPEHHLRNLEAPAYFGEIGVLAAIPRTATIITTTRCRCLRIEGADLLDALETATISSAVLQDAYAHLVRTHPSLRPRFASGPDAGGDG